MFLKSLSGRFLLLTIIGVMLAEVLIFVPSMARFRLDYLQSRLERAQIASLALLAAPDQMVEPELEAELLRNAGVLNVALKRDEVRELMLTSPMQAPIDKDYDLRTLGPFALIGNAFDTLLNGEGRVIRVQGEPVARVEDIFDGQDSATNLITQRLAELKSNIIGQTTLSVAETQEVTILADKSVPFAVIKKIMSTCTGEGYENVSLAVIQKAGATAAI